MHSSSRKRAAWLKFKRPCTVKTPTASLVRESAILVPRKKKDETKRNNQERIPVWHYHSYFLKKIRNLFFVNLSSGGIAA